MMTNQAQDRSSIFQILKQKLTGPKTVKVRISAYGKLPLYKDFLRHGLAAPESQACKRWLDRGVSQHWAAHDTCREHEIGAHSVLFSFPGTGRHLLGFLWGSSDEGSLRRFPFLLFTSLPGTSLLTSLEALDQLTVQADNLRRELAAIHDINDFYPRIRTATFELTLYGDSQLRERMRESFSDCLVGELASRLYGDDATEKWPALLAYAKRCRDSPSQSHAAVRLPTSPHLPLGSQTELWCRLFFGRQFRRSSPIQVLCSADGNGIVILRRELRTDDVFVLHPDMPDYEYVEDLRHDVPSRAEVSPSSEEEWRQPLDTLLD